MKKDKPITFNYLRGLSGLSRSRDSFSMLYSVSDRRTKLIIFFERLGFAKVYLQQENLGTGILDNTIILGSVRSEHELQRLAKVLFGKNLD